MVESKGLSSLTCCDINSVFVEVAAPSEIEGDSVVLFFCCLCVPEQNEASSLDIAVVSGEMV